MIYRTEDLARWGIGKGSNLLPAEIDGNFWDLASRLVAVEGAAGSAANGIETITVTGSQMTVWLEDGTALGPHTLPTAMIRYRGDWAEGAAYAELDLVSVPEVGLYLVLRDHTSVGPFDANARDAENNLLYRWLMPMAAPGGTSLGQLNDVDLSTAPADGETLVHAGGAWYPGLPTMGLGDLAGVFPGTPADGDVLAWVAADSAWRAVAPAGGGGGAAALGDLSDVTLAGAAAGQFLGHDGTAWVNVTVGWSDLSGMPATVAGLPAALGSDGQVLKVVAGAIAWAADETGGGGGGGIADAPSDGQLYARQDASWTAFSIPAPDGAYRYWRLRLVSEDQQGATTVRFGEMEFRGTAGVPEQATGGTVLSSAGWTNPANTFDGTNSSSALSQPFLDRYIGYDFGTPRTVAEVLIQSPNNLSANCPERFVIEASNDDVAYSVILTVDPVTPAWDGFGIVEKTFVLPVETVDWSTLSGVPATVAALPAALGTSGQVLKVQGNGSVAWDADDNSGGGGGGGGSYTLPDIAPPEAAWFPTAIGSPTVSQDTGGLRFDGAAASAQVRATFKTLPAADTVITVRVDPTTRFESNFNGGGILLRDSASGRCLLIGIMSVSNKPWTEMGEWSSATAFSAPTAGSSRKWDGTFPTWFRASYVHAAGAITGAWSFDGETWVTMGTSSWLAAPDQSGIGLVCRNAADPATIRFTFYDDGTQTGERVTIGGGGPAPIEDIAGTTYVQVAGDAGTFKRTTSADAVTITIAAGVNAPGDEITFCQSGAGLVTFAAGAGMVLDARGGALASAGQHAVMGVKFITGSEAVLFGDIA